MGSKVRIKIKTADYMILLKKIYLKKSNGWTLVRKYKSYLGLGKYVAIMSRKFPNG